MAGITEDYARRILLKAIAEDRAAELLNCLFDGGSVTLDAMTGNLSFASKDMLRQMWDTDE